MKIIIQTPDFTATRKLTHFVEKSVSKLETYEERILEARVCLKTDASDSKENKVCEIKAVIPGNDLFASRQSKTFEESVKLVVDALKHQIERLKTVEKQQRNVVGPVNGG